MWIASVSLLTLWMVFALLGITLLGFTHLLCVGAITIEVLRRPVRRLGQGARVRDTFARSRVSLRRAGPSAPRQVPGAQARA